MVTANDRKPQSNSIFTSFLTHQKRQKSQGEKNQAMCTPANTIVHQVIHSYSCRATVAKDNTVFIGISPFKCGVKF